MLAEELNSQKAQKDHNEGHTAWNCVMHKPNVHHLGDSSFLMDRKNRGSQHVDGGAMHVWVADLDTKNCHALPNSAVNFQALKGHLASNRGRNIPY